MRRLVIAPIMVATIHTTLAEEKQSPAKPSADKRPTKVWNRTGPLGETPKRTTDAYPLSDQENKGGWVTMRKEKLPPEAEKLGSKDYTSAALHTKARSSYGYYEVKAKPMNSGGSGLRVRTA